MPPREARTYVDVILRVGALGTQTPLAVVLPDGRVYEVSYVTERRRERCGMSYTVHIGTHATQLYRADGGFEGGRWFVVMREGGKAPA